MDDDDDDEPTMKAPRAQASHNGPPSSRGSPSRGGGAPWVPNGRPGTAHRSGSRGHSPAGHPTGGGGGRRTRAVEGSHVFVEHPNLSPTHPSNAFWLYGCFEFKMQIPLEQAKATCTRLVDKLVDRMNRMAAAAAVTASPGAAGHDGGSAGELASHSLHTGGSELPTGVDRQSSSAASSGPSGVRRDGPRANLVFDIISTRKHITADFETGLPYQLGREIYQYAEVAHGTRIVTCFVGLSDNTSRRVGRDVYAKSDELAKTRLPFSAIDSEHLFIVFPPSPSAAAAAAAPVLSPPHRSGGTSRNGPRGVSAHGQAASSTPGRLGAMRTTSPGSGHAPHPPR